MEGIENQSGTFTDDLGARSKALALAMREIRSTGTIIPHFGEVVEKI